MKDYSVCIPRDVYFNKKLSSCDVVVYSTIYILCIQSPLDKEFVDVDRVVYYIHGNCTTRRVKDGVRESINNLIDEGIICGEKLSCSSYLIATDQFNFKNHFATVPLAGYKKILSRNTKRDYSIFRYYCAIMGSRGSDGISSIKSNYFMDRLEIASFNTINSYNDELESLKLLYISRGKTLITDAGDIYKENNVYCAYDDRYKLFNAKSMGQKLAQLKKGKQYSDEEVREIYDYVDAHNEQELKKASKNPNYVSHTLTK